MVIYYRGNLLSTTSKKLNIVFGLFTTHTTNQQNHMEPGKVFIASMNMRGAWADAPSGAVKVNVTSAQATLSENRRDFSPMNAIEGGYKGFYNFEAYWQSGKVFEGIPEEKVKQFWHKVAEPKRRYPNSKKRKVLHASFEDEPNKNMGYVKSRKKVMLLV